MTVWIGFIWLKIMSSCGLRLPTWKVMVSTYLQSERFLFIIFYKLVLKLLIIFKALVLNPYVHVLCSS
jgi:hypothetical protein